jgi:hypothetical protein
MPGPASAMAANHVWRRSFPFRAKKRLAGFRLSATDVDWTVGDGPAVVGSMGAILLLVTGRTVSLPELTGDGVDRLVESC